MIWRVVVRVGIWLIGLLVALAPTLHTSGVRPWHIGTMAGQVNQAGFFRDFFFVSIVITIVSATNLLERLFIGRWYRADWAKVIAFVALLYYLFTLVYGTLRFAQIASVHQPLTDIEEDVAVIVVTLVASLVTEVGIAVNDWSRQNRDDR